MHRWTIQIRDLLRTIPLLAQDGLIYVASAAFALITIAVAVSADYRAWGEMAAIAYGFGGIVCLVASAYRRFREDPHFIRWMRRVVAALLVAGAVLLPLAAELTWRADAKPGAHAQPEVAVIERAGDRVAHDQSLYLAHPDQDGASPSSDAPNLDADAFFPYLPGMVPFGLLNAIHAPKVLTDARFGLVSFSLLIMAIALLVSGSGASRRVRVVQVLVALPSGALPMVTGGDDLPVLSLLLLGLVLAARRRPVLAGIALGCAATLKFTAWPLVGLMLLAVRDREGRRAPTRYLIAVLAVLVPPLIAGIASAPGAFLVNAIRFPLGLANVRSPAASPLIGQVLTSLLPGDRRLITVALVVIGLCLVVVYVARHLPRTPAEVARSTAVVLGVAVLLAPATRFGYLIYPLNLAVWSYFLAEVGATETDQSSSSFSINRSVTELVDPEGGPPASAEVIAPLAR